MKKSIFVFLFFTMMFLAFFDVHAYGREGYVEDIVLYVGKSRYISEACDSIFIQNTGICTVKDREIEAVKPGKTNVLYNIDGTVYIRSITVRRTGISVSMLDIGQGDSILIRVNNRNILLDTGERVDCQVELTHFFK